MGPGVLTNGVSEGSEELVLPADLNLGKTIAHSVRAATFLDKSAQSSLLCSSLYSSQKQWARADLNHRIPGVPDIERHSISYEPGALTRLSYGPALSATS